MDSVRAIPCSISTGDFRTSLTVYASSPSVALQTEGREAKYCGGEQHHCDADDVGVAREAPEVEAVEATPVSVRHSARF